MSLFFFPKAEIMGTQRQMGYSEMHVGGIEVGSMVTSSSPGFRGSLQQLIFNGQKLFEMANTGLLTLKYNVNVFCNIFLYLWDFFFTFHYKNHPCNIFLIYELS